MTCNSTLRLLGLGAAGMLSIAVVASSAGATTVSISNQVLNNSSGYTDIASGTTSPTAEINYVSFIPNNANSLAVQYDNAANTVSLAPNIFAAGLARGPNQGIEVNGYAQSNGGIGGTIPSGDTNLFLAGQPNTNNPGFGAHANWVVTLNLDAIRTNFSLGSAPLTLTGTFGAWGAIGDPTTTGGNVQGEVWLDGSRIDTMPQASFSPVNNPTFSLSIPSSAHELSFFILNSPTSSNWDDGIFENVNIATPEPTSLALFAGVGALSLARRRKA